MSRFASLVALSVLFLTSSNVVANIIPSPALLVSRQIWFYCILINYISTHFQTRTAAASNPFVSQFPVGASATVSAESHASFYQIVDLDNGAGTTCVLEGTGEDVQMLTPAGANSCTFVGTSSTIPVTLSALFQYSKSGPTGPTSNSKVQTPTVADDGPFLDIIIITTEDDTDDDNNDTFL